MINIRLPNITASTDAGKLQQLQSYMHQLVEQLNWALNNIDSSSSPSQEKVTTAAPAAEKDDPISNFHSIKGLIIKSADIVNAYYEKIDALLKLSGEYVAEATFPDGSAKFVEKTGLTVYANSKYIEDIFEDLQEITSSIEGVENTLIAVNAHIKSGLLYYDDSGVPIYGLEIGQRTEVDGVEVFDKYARFTSDKLSFYDNNGNEVAYISDKKLFITHVEVTGSFALGGFVDTVLSDKSVVTRWVAGGVG